MLEPNNNNDARLKSIKRSSYLNCLFGNKISTKQPTNFQKKCVPFGTTTLFLNGFVLLWEPNKQTNTGKYLPQLSFFGTSSSSL
ncbi:hypothetical protein DERP_003765 [Dermatophagoides pteronyssinus]|uniref:Uncharacterized protein n=1 Tax=Dermatophagoides pteronyssinus TaxID=6956 RepID=A0ABQ8JLJ5_DERPT|nr:hypothetical protein DERP_003765 [Dermatophagoides pteronyssinus]